MITFITILVVHFLADFVFQSSKMATGKSKSLKWLSIHVVTYALVSFITFLFIFTNYGDLSFALSWWLINIALHFVVDLITSKITSKFWEEKNMRLFFVMIGLDQLIHNLCLIITFFWLKETQLLSVQA
ncbi:MAG: DUF3307 domain-containing protein [Bacteroidia bacterium]|nr:DUF3307 domain-containing protein [Bacteroidia bacterium]